MFASPRAPESGRYPQSSIAASSSRSNVTVLAPQSPFAQPIAKPRRGGRRSDVARISSSPIFAPEHPQLQQSLVRRAHQRRAQHRRQRNLVARIGDDAQQVRQIVDLARIVEAPARDSRRTECPPRRTRP